MYVRTNPAAPIRWEPSDERAAREAMAAVGGTGIEDPTDVDPENPVELSDEAAARVREEYRRLTDSGGP